MPPAKTETFGARCAKAAALANIIMMGALQNLADLIDREVAAYKAERAKSDAPPPAPPMMNGKPLVEDFGDPKKIPPTPEQVTAFFAHIGYPIDGNEFCDSYESKGWKVGRVAMKNWQSACHNWKRNRWGHLIKPRAPGTGGPRKF